ncbi:TIGR03862 family flavoprotein [Akkermansiaceae bacterium]|nr:TIGR03862 family flavoprotein [Akkermansiaceae bacterium]MDB4459433.1 TIGR03862 family flavoprotein [bacterium]MDB4519329.1 TIGR03862 family flavoprotein [Akkermansiaceae bacterium]
MPHILVIGGGPAGLRAAEVASASGAKVTLCEQKRSVGRKFLIAGKGGLNLTHSEELDTFVEKYRGPDQPEGFWKETVGRFDNKMIRGWAARLDVGTFVQKSGRVYPKSLKAAPLLRRWIKKLRDQEVELRMNHRLVSLSQESAEFETPEGTLTIEADAIILAMGGASWPQTGSDGAWVEFLKAAGISVTSLSSANCGWEVAWPEDLVPLVEAQPLKNIILSCAGEDAPGELMLTRYGMEGGPIYKLGPALREMESPLIKIDLKPTFTAEKLAAKMESVKRNFLAESAQRWKLSEVARLLLEYFHGPFESSRQLAVAAKALTIPLTKARPIAEAISSAGGVTWSVLDSELMLRELPGVFVAGEMIDWEAPTGGYLLQGCFASGTLAAEAALKFIELP